MVCADFGIVKLPLGFTGSSPWRSPVRVESLKTFIGGGEDSGDFETAVIDPSTERFYRVNARLTNDGITIIDHARNTRRVLTSNPSLYNLVAREYQYNTQDASSASSIETSSSAVIHQIDQPLMIDN